MTCCFSRRTSAQMHAINIIIAWAVILQEKMPFRVFTGIIRLQFILCKFQPEKILPAPNAAPSTACSRPTARAVAAASCPCTGRYTGYGAPAAPPAPAP